MSAQRQVGAREVMSVKVKKVDLTSKSQPGPVGTLGCESACKIGRRLGRIASS